MTTRREKLRKRFAAFRLKFAGHVLRTHPRIVFKIILGIVILFPWLVSSLVMSFFRVIHWRKIATCRDFLRRHALAFDGVDPLSLTVESASGGVSNSNQIWHCRLAKTGEPRPELQAGRKTTGEDVRYFVKIFLSAGSFWAKHQIGRAHV